jgi:hypothetical protein
MDATQKVILAAVAAFIVGVVCGQLVTYLTVVM